MGDTILSLVWFLCLMAYQLFVGYLMPKRKKFIVCFLASGVPLWGVLTGPKVFLDLAGRVWAAALRPDPLLKKALCRTCPVVGRRINKEFNAKAILLVEQSWYYLTHSWEGVHTFPKGICPKVNVIARLEFELAYYDSAVHRFNHYTTRTPWYYTCANFKLLIQTDLINKFIQVQEIYFIHPGTLTVCYKFHESIQIYSHKFVLNDQCFFLRQSFIFMHWGVYLLI